jgi:hypothetical protein
MKQFTRLLIFLVLLVPCLAMAQYSFPNRRAIIANVCPHLKVTSFKFENVYERSMDRFSSDYSWENVGTKEVEAFELVILRYDPFNDQLIGARSIFPGHNSATYKPLKPGEKDSDGSSSISSDKVYTAIIYIRSIRFTDGTIWRANPADVLASMKAQVPDITDPGKLIPPSDPKKGDS